MIKFLDLHSQYVQIKDEIDKAISSVISESAFVGGKYVSEFEERFAAYQQANYCVGVGNGTDALEIAIEALSLEKGSEIIVPANSFIASSEAVTRTGHKVIFCDCNLYDYTIDIEDVLRKLNPRTSAIIAVHQYGHPCDMDALVRIARDFGIKIIEDCAQAHGAEYKGRKVGSIGDVGAFSFYPGKNLGAYGDAGAIITNDKSLAVRCRMIANHGRISKYNHEFEGRNSRLDAIQAAVLGVKLNYLDVWLDRRIKVADLYRKYLSGLDVISLPNCSSWAKHVYHLFVIRCKRRNELKRMLEGNGVEVGIHYPISLPKLPAYKYLGQVNGCSNADNLEGEILSLPMGEHIIRDDIMRISDLVHSFALDFDGDV